jgi:hypothetical protein
MQQRLLIVHRLRVLQLVQEAQLKAKGTLFVVAGIHIVANQQHNLQQLVEAVVVPERLARVQNVVQLRAKLTRLLAKRPYQKHALKPLREQWHV